MEQKDDKQSEPLAKTRTRRSNAGARMHEMIFNADDEELFAQTYSGLLKADDDSSEDEEYVPKDLDVGDPNDVDVSEDGTSDSDSDSNSDDSDEDEEEDEEEDKAQEDENDLSNNVDHKNNLSDNKLFDLNKISNIKLESSEVVTTTTKGKKGQSILQKQTLTNTTLLGSPSKLAYDACKKICSVCLGDQSDEDDEIIECDSCGVSVHESCYGVLGDTMQHVNDDNNDINNHQHHPLHHNNNNHHHHPQQQQQDVVSNDTDCDNKNDKNDLNNSDNISQCSNISSESTEPWFCEPCKRSVKNPLCELCPNKGGIFKQTDTGRWIHMVCALYTRGITFENIDCLSGVSLFELNYSLYGSKACTICEDRRLARSGICIGCDAGLCKTFFHVTCAQKEGLLFESHADEVDPYFAHCKQHADKTIIRKKKRTFTALFARLKRIQPLQNCSDRIKKKLSEITQQLNPNLKRWTPENRPPIPTKVSRSLMTSPSLIINLTKKSELMGLEPKSAFMTVQDEMEMARQKWHIPPAFDLEFVAYCKDRTTRMALMKKQNVELVNQNMTLKNEEANLREKYNSIKELVGSMRFESEKMIKEARTIQKLVAATTGKQFNLPLQMEQLIARCTNFKTKNHSKPSNKSSDKSKSIVITNNKTSSTYGCGKCGTIKDQHLLALCDTCHQYIHIYCLDPPLTRVPKKTKFGGWQCSDCSERDEEEQEEALEEQNELALQEAAQDGPRRLRERIKFPEKYCHESMMMADFWSTQKKRSKKSTKKGKIKSKKPKVE